VFVQEIYRELQDLAYKFLEGFFIREMRTVHGEDWIKMVKV
jgi:hypothetical protein